MNVPPLLVFFIPTRPGWHAAEEFDSFDQYSGKYGIRNPSRILARGKPLYDNVMNNFASYLRGGDH